MPSLGRLKDGRIMLLWNSTRPLPEMERSEATRFLAGNSINNGVSQIAFTNRDAIHAAISDDDGRTWTGFREVALDEKRNDSDYAGHGGTDRGVHSNQFVELGGGKILAAIGQHPLHRVLVIFDADWLSEKKCESSFANGLEDWSVQKYIAGLRGHAAFGRKPGGTLVDDPDEPGKRILRIRRPNDPSLFTENDGAVWNFPAGKAGALTVRIRLEIGGQGGRISLLDRWMNPIDFASEGFAMFNLKVAGDGTAGSSMRFVPGKWHDLRFEWIGVDDLMTGLCQLFLDGQRTGMTLPLNRPSVNGINYVHFMSIAEAEDEAGFLVASVSATVA
jgi:hypothetical protein